MTGIFQSCSFLVTAPPFQSNRTLNLPKLTQLKTNDLRARQESWSSYNYPCRSHRACGQLATCLPVPFSQGKDAEVNISFLKTNFKISSLWQSINLFFPDTRWIRLLYTALALSGCINEMSNCYSHVRQHARHKVVLETRLQLLHIFPLILAYSFSLQDVFLVSQLQIYLLSMQHYLKTALKRTRETCAPAELLNMR